MSKTPKKKSTSYRIYQIIIAVVAFVMILSMIVAALRIL
jgi:hypothetical protein